jgi:hypothetical protein
MLARLSARKNYLLTEYKADSSRIRGEAEAISDSRVP